MARLHIFAPALLALPLLLAGCDQLSGLVSKKESAQAPQERVVRVTCVELTPHKVDIQRELTGRTSSYRWAEVRPEVGGILKERCFTEGSLVKEGDVLYRIEPDTYKAALDKARADLASAEANLNVTKLRERRTASMLKTKSVSQQDYDDVKATLRQAQASVQACKAAVDSAEINYRRTEVRAPISGRITLSNYTVGALLTASQASPLATIYQTDPVYVEVSQSTDDLYTLKKQFEKGEGMKSVDPSHIKALLTMHDGEYYPSAGHLNFTGVNVDQTTNTITLRAEFPNPDEMLLPGLFVRVSIVMGEDTQAILAPQKAVLRDLKGKPYVYVLNKDNVAERRFITISHAIGNDWYVTDGLTLGEKIVLNGVHNVRSGMKVQEISEEQMKAEQESGGAE
ncbi:efflux RND transporter periplasmic adaptor subunit [Mailhella massiliensis]|uniref:Efflux RND transporter periplasmic adaptor subunit n=1 Tax=Mailhella massiliensis TaxID=1903261 RepID=A0A921DRP5_9BACT|nr:efflux RND transporter periplasmic adaptor subunit [Mailhella massiliensis]HJD96227.1 efflux RND transporter periplasmic adaptor subunit [Mailhella massiliensis]